MNTALLEHSPFTVTLENFNELVLNSDMPVLIEFWSPNCIPCNLMKRVVRSAAEALSGEVRVGLVDAMQQSDIVAHFGAKSTPMFYLVSRGQVVVAFAGMSSVGTLVRNVRQHLA